MVSVPRKNAFEELKKLEKEKIDPKEMKKIKEDLMNTRKFNTEADVDQLEKTTIVCVLAEFAK